MAHNLVVRKDPRLSQAGSYFDGEATPPGKREMASRLLGVAKVRSTVDDIDPALNIIRNMP